jgi:hypothetical protein
MKQIKFIEPVNSSNAMNYINDGYELLCPRCRSKLDVSFYMSKETNEKSLHQIVCPVSSNHCTVIYEPSDLRQIFKKIVTEA